MLQFMRTQLNDLLVAKVSEGFNFKARPNSLDWAKTRILVGFAGIRLGDCSTDAKAASLQNVSADRPREGGLQMIDSAMVFIPYATSYIL